MRILEVRAHFFFGGGREGGRRAKESYTLLLASTRYLQIAVTTIH